MSTFFIADLHLGHKAILDYCPMRGGENIDEHDDWIVEQWNSVVRGKKDLVWVLGDVCFDRSKLGKLAQMNGRKILVLGNHDEFGVEAYLPYFDKIYGLHRRYGSWLSHAPVDSRSLRGKHNIHGHMHWDYLDDDRYTCVSVERCNGVPISLEEIKKRIEKK